jgi:hypothetical protein
VHGLGRQEPPKKNTPPTWVQKPPSWLAVQLVPMQHEPVGCGLHGLPGLQETPWPQSTFAPAHAGGALVWVQVPALRSQHAPLLAEHVVVPQVVPAPEKELGLVQPEAIVVEQVAMLEQHAPLSAAHGSGEHDAAAPTTPVNVPGARQPDWMVTVQKPMFEQQRPSNAGQGVGKQVVPAPRKLLVPVHPLALEFEAMKQPPTLLQQAPVTFGQGVGLQVVPAPWKPPKQPRTVVDVQEPAAAQHAPRSGAHGSLGEQVEPLPW